MNESGAISYCSQNRPFPQLNSDYSRKDPACTSWQKRKMRGGQVRDPTPPLPPPMPGRRSVGRRVNRMSHSQNHHPPPSARARATHSSAPTATMRVKVDEDEEEEEKDGIRINYNYSNLFRAEIPLQSIIKFTIVDLQL